jgi:hypothetical protein
MVQVEKDTMMGMVLPFGNGSNPQNCSSSRLLLLVPPDCYSHYFMLRSLHDEGKSINSQCYLVVFNPSLSNKARQWERWHSDQSSLCSCRWQMILLCLVDFACVYPPISSDSHPLPIDGHLNKMCGYKWQSAQSHNFSIHIYIHNIYVRMYACICIQIGKQCWWCILDKFHQKQASPHNTEAAN